MAEQTPYFTMSIGYTQHLCNALVNLSNSKLSRNYVEALIVLEDFRVLVSPLTSVKNNDSVRQKIRECRQQLGALKVPGGEISVADQVNEIQECLMDVVYKAKILIAERSEFVIQ